MKDRYEQGYRKIGPNRNEIDRRELIKWQGRLEAAGSMARFAKIWATRLVYTDLEIPRPPQIPRQRVEIRTLVGEIKLS